jgi:hypothetical protein
MRVGGNMKRWIRDDRQVHRIALNPQILGEKKGPYFFVAVGTGRVVILNGKREAVSLNGPIFSFSRAESLKFKQRLSICWSHTCHGVFP